LFVSTNHLERLDAALRRPGRLEVQIELGYASDTQRRKVFERFFPASTLAGEFADRSSGVPLTVADLQEYLLERRHDEARAIRDVPDWIRSRKASPETTSSPTHNESGCGRLPVSMP
jgi:chaperone BCS1